MNFKKIAWIPLDLPMLDSEITLENIGNFYNYVPNVSEEERKKYTLQKQHYKYAWNTFRLRKPASSNPDWTNQNSDEEWQWNEDALTVCPKLVSYITENLPFKKLKAVSIMSSNGIVPAHLDMYESASLTEKRNYIENEPSIYRLIVDGAIHKNSFYVVSPSLGKRYVTLPEDSPGWAMGAYSCAHGNDEPIPHQKLVAYIMGDLDKEKHFNLIERSYLKYKEFAIEL